MMSEAVSRRTSLRHQLRVQEMETVRSWFRPGLRVLELGAGTGLQASIMQGWGCDVVALDVARATGPLKFDVEIYDGRNIPFPDSSFDIVFSSNVLEHIRPVEPILREIKRVLRPDGVSIHGMPTTSWRFWSSITHYPFLALYAASLIRGKQLDGAPSATELTKSRGLLRTLIGAVIPPAHGEFSSSLAELFYFRRGHWIDTLERAGFDVQEIRANGIAYSGHTVLPWLSLSARRKLAGVVGSAVAFYIGRKADLAA